MVYAANSGREERVRQLLARGVCARTARDKWDRCAAGLAASTLVSAAVGRMHWRHCSAPSTPSLSGGSATTCCLLRRPALVGLAEARRLLYGPGGFRRDVGEDQMCRIAQQLLDAGCAVAGETRSTPLLASISASRLSLMSLLLDAGASAGEDANGAEVRAAQGGIEARAVLWMRQHVPAHCPPRHELLALYLPPCSRMPCRCCTY